MVGVALLASATFLWAGGFVAARYVSGAIGGSGFDPFAVLAARTLIAAAAFIPLALMGRVGRIARADFGLLALVAGTGQFGYLLLYHLGAEGSSAATASLIINLAPVIGTVAGIVWLKDQVTTARVAGVALAVAGTIPVSLADGGDFALSTSVVWLLLSAVAAGVYVVAGKPLVTRYGGLTVTAWGWWISAPFSLPFVGRWVDQAPNASRSALIALAYLGLGSSVVAYVAWGNGLARTTASAAATWLFLTPVIAVFGAWIILSETPGAVTLAGGAVALLGVWLASRNPTTAPLPPEH